MKESIFTREYVRGAGRSFDKAGHALAKEWAKKTTTGNPLYVLMSNLGVLQKKIDRFVKERQDPAFIQEEVEAGILLVNDFYRKAIVKKVEKAQAIINRVKAAEIDIVSKRDPSAELLAVTNAMNKFGGMTNSELSSEADRYMTALNPIEDIQVLDALSKEMLQRGGLNRHEALREAMKRNNAGELWRSDQVAKAALQEIGFYEGITPGRVSFKVKGSDQKESTMGFAIKDLIQIKNLSQLDERAAS